MLNKFIGDVRSKVDEVRQTVTQQAVKAREVFGLPSFQELSAAQLERQLESQATQASTLLQLHDVYVKWIAHILLSVESDTPLYFDAPISSKFQLRSFLLNVTETQSSSLGDLSTKSAWISSQNSTPDPPPDPPHQQVDGLTYHQVFLRSQTIELALLSLARIAPLRSLLVGPADEGGTESSTRGALQRLMALTLRGDAKMHTELLCMFCSVDLKSDAWELILCHLAEILALLKVDWQEVYFKEKRKKAQADIESLKFSLHQVTPPNPDAVGLAGTDEAELMKEAQAQQLIKRNVISQKIAETQIEICKAVELAAVRRSVVESTIQSRLVVLLESIEKLEKKFSNLGTKATDRSAVVSQESEVKEAELERSLRELTEKKNEMDSSVSQLEQRKQELLKELADVESQLLEALTQQREVSEHCESLTRQKQTHQKSCEHRLSVAQEVKRQSDLHHKDMQNMEILVQRSELVIKQHLAAEAEALEKEQEVWEHPKLAAIENHLRQEVEFLKSEKERVASCLQVLQVMWESRRAKQEGVKQGLQHYYEKEKEYQTQLREESELPPPPDKSQLLELRKTLEQLRAAAEAANGGLQIINSGVIEAQQRVLRVTTSLSNAWHRISEFLESISTEIDTPASTESADTDTTEYVDVGEFHDAESSPSSPANKQTEKAKSDAKALVVEAREVYTQTKELIANKTHLLEAQS